MVSRLMTRIFSKTEIIQVSGPKVFFSSSSFTSVITELVRRKLMQLAGA